MGRLVGADTAGTDSIVSVVDDCREVSPAETHEAA
jgi:hypothetical protein